ncbi:MAG: hypothetical protein MJ016_08795, partial [Victivallaceae bacterium]|nr:hypothetical protein [Victivallaceae bacterium]
SMIIMMIIKGKMFVEGALVYPEYYGLLISIGILGGLAQMVSAICQGKAAAGACVAYAETEQGFANYLMVLGIIETCAIFALVFSLMMMP